MNFNLASTSIVVALLATLAARPSAAQEVLTYGVDPVPNSQYWNGEYPTFYGVDPVPSTTLAGDPYLRKYGQDPIPDARVYTRSLDVAPRFQDQQRLTRAADGSTKSVKPAPSRRRQRGR